MSLSLYFLSLLLLKLYYSQFDCDSLDDICFQRYLNNDTAFIYYGNLGGNLRCSTVASVCNYTYLGISTGSSTQAIECLTDYSCINGRFNLFDDTTAAAKLDCRSVSGCENTVVDVSNIFYDRIIDCSDSSGNVCKDMEIYIENTYNSAKLDLKCTQSTSCPNLMLNVNGNATVTITCEQPNSCLGMIINSYGYSNITVDCGTDNACGNITVDATYSNSINFICNGRYTCNSLNATSYNNGNITIDCTQTFESCQNMLLGNFGGVIYLECDGGTSEACTELNMVCSGSNSLCKLDCAGSNDCDFQTIECNDNSICVITLTDVTPIGSVLSCSAGSSCECGGYNCTTQTPTVNPTSFPSTNPTENTLSPSVNPTETPTSFPSTNPTRNPSVTPTFNTNSPSLNPTEIPSVNPSTNPTTNPSINPSKHPSKTPTAIPTIQPSFKGDSKSNNLTFNATICIFVIIHLILLV